MSGIKLGVKQKKLIEKLGVVYEHSGMTPASSRVLALLLVSDELELGFDDIREALNLSKSATSNAVNSLLNASRIEYFTIPGKRKRYFRSMVNDWQEKVTKSMQGLTAYSFILKEVLDQRSPSTKIFNNKLGELISFMDYINLEIPKILHRWQAAKQQEPKHAIK